MSIDTATIVQIEAAVRTLPDWQARPLSINPAIAVLASPSWRGVDGSPWRVTDEKNDKSLFVKVMEADAKLHVDFSVAFQAARYAAELGVGPKVYFADSATGILIMEDLNKGWRVVTLEQLNDSSVVDSILNARLIFQSGPAIEKQQSVFDEIAIFYARAKEAGASLPSTTSWMVSELQFAEEAIKALPRNLKPIHGDGNVSNVMMSDIGEIRLIDWDRATMADPLEDIGSFLVEAFSHEPEAWDAFRRLTGDADEKAFNRAMIYGVADDLRWGLIGALVAAKTSRATHEFLKFANWRFTRCGLTLRSPQFGNWIRRMS